MAWWTRLAAACGSALLDVHVDADHHRSVLTLAGPEVADAVFAMCELAMRTIDLRRHVGVHPRLGAVDVVPFVALDGSERDAAVTAARAVARRLADELAVPTFLYDEADPAGRTLPTVRRDAFVTRAPDHGPPAPHPTFGATAVGARPPLVAVNCVLASADLGRARAIARSVRERDGGLPGVRALGLALASRGRAQVSMNLVALERTGIEEACAAVVRAAQALDDRVVEVELVGLVPAAEVARCSAEFRSWVGLGADRTIEGRWAARTSGTPDRRTDEAAELTCRAARARARRMRRRSRSDNPPQIPNFSPLTSAYSRQSARTSQPAQTALASRVDAPRSGKKKSGSTPRQLARNCHVRRRTTSSSEKKICISWRSRTCTPGPSPK